MKNVNLTGLYLAMITNFGVNGFDLHSIIPEGGEPIDALICFRGGNEKLNDIDKINEMVSEHITGDVKQVKVDITALYIQVYIEFTNSTFIES
jgi:hypothetical protein